MVWFKLIRVHVFLFLPLSLSIGMHSYANSKPHSLGSFTMHTPFYHFLLNIDAQFYLVYASYVAYSGCWFIRRSALYIWVVPRAWPFVHAVRYGDFHRCCILNVVPLRRRLRKLRVLWAPKINKHLRWPIAGTPIHLRKVLALSLYGKVELRDQ